MGNDHHCQMKKLLILSSVRATGVMAWSGDYLRERPYNGGAGWVKGEKIFNVADVKNGKRLWKAKVDAASRAKHNLFAPLIVQSVKTANGAKQIALVACVSDDPFATDAETGTLLWTKPFDSSVELEGGGVLCLGGPSRLRGVVGPAEAIGCRQTRSQQSAGTPEERGFRGCLGQRLREGPPIRRLGLPVNRGAIRRCSPCGSKPSSGQWA